MKVESLQFIGNPYKHRREELMGGYVRLFLSKSIYARFLLSASKTQPTQRGVKMCLCRLRSGNVTVNKGG